ncbi:hypothetical protein [Xenorhabdus thailandensis]|uniref:hypothetical protein n=1 Tax=Xenorhabdus thailandensis TaxID=3136255 RepID=UPI0030F3D0A7
MTLFTRKLESSVHTQRQFVKAQHLPVLDGSLSLGDYLKQMGERSALIVAECSGMIIPDTSKNC